MHRSSSRLVELDFLRGLVLLIIVVDHVGGSILSRATLHAYALCDAAEVFVFLGGFATATAYTALAERRGAASARKRFFRRSLELYRAFLVTAGVMLLVSALFTLMHIDGPNLALTDLDDMIDTPAAVFADILLLRRQPYLASILPMYALFALSVPAIVPLARRKPWLLLAGSIGLWAAAPTLGNMLQLTDGAAWDFNPFAWQLMFVLGVIARCQPVHQRIASHRFGWTVSMLAFAIVAAAAYYKLHLESTPLDSSTKQSLAALRIVNFLAIAWWVAQAIRAGWVARVARRLTWVSEVGRNGMLCFIASTAISLSVDTLLYATTDGYLDIARGLLADAVAIGALLAVAKLVAPWSRTFAQRSGRAIRPIPTTTPSTPSSARDR
jgi:hypothetical protein